MNNPASYIRLGVLSLFWGTSFLFIKLALGALAPTQLAFARIVLGAIVLLLLCKIRGFRLRGHGLWGKVAIAGLFGNALPWTMFAIGEQTVSSGLTGVLNATTPLWTVLLGLLFGSEEALGRWRLAGIGLGFVGVVLILAPWESGVPGWGVLACMTAPLSYGISLVYIGRNLTSSTMRARGIPPLAIAAMQMTAASVLAALALPLGGLHPVRLNLVALLAITALGVVGTGFAFALNYRLLTDEGPTTASTVTYLIPAISVLVGWLVLGENIGLRVLAGMAVVLAGIALIRQSRSAGSTSEREKVPQRAGN